MNFFKEYILSFIKNNIIQIICIFLELILIIFLLFKVINQTCECNDYNKEINTIEENNEEKMNNDIIEDNDVIIDIKGAIKNPGVYKLPNKTIINDVIKTAGGLTKNATTINLNLSAQIFDRMVIYVATKQELEKNINFNTNNVVVEIKKDNDMKIDNDAKIDNSKSEGIEIKEETNNSKIEDKTDKSSNSLISINNATKEELMQIPNIGESKAQKILEYREENGLFKSLEDIKNVSGIGEALFEKIKDYIIL